MHFLSLSHAIIQGRKFKGYLGVLTVGFCRLLWGFLTVFPTLYDTRAHNGRENFFGGHNISLILKRNRVDIQKKDLSGNSYGIFSEVQNGGSNMADQPSNFEKIFMKIFICGFVGSVITNPTLIFSNSRWRRQYGVFLASYLMHIKIWF